MARYDLYRNESEGIYLLDVQADLLDHLNTRVVVPLLPPDVAPAPGRRLNPAFVIEGRKYVMVTQFLSALAASELPPASGNLSRHHDQIVAALDMLFEGF
jgi:toxin CcdB